jgi:KUP system potassium uptake protein
MRNGSLPYIDVAEAVHDFRFAMTSDVDHPDNVEAMRLTAIGLVNDQGEGASEVPLVDVSLSDPNDLRPVASLRPLGVPASVPKSRRPLQPSPMTLRARDRTTAAAQSAESEVAYEADTLGAFIDDYGAYQWEHAAFAGVAKVSVGTALRDPDKEMWIKAIRAEIFSLLGMDSDGRPIRGARPTLRDVGNVAITGPHRVIHSTAQLKKKQHQDGSLNKYKCRLCGCGNELYGQIAETYSPTIGALAYAAVHQIAIIDRMEKCVVDVVQAYLHQDYPEDAEPLYLTLPDNVAHACDLPTGHRYRVCKYLYGLPDAGLAYYKAYSAHLIAGGYERTVSDPCLFVKVSADCRTYVWCHVDDTFVCSSKKKGLNDFISHVKSKFDITVSHNVTEYLGIKLDQLPSGAVRLTQPKLLLQLFQEFAEQLAAFKRRPTAPQRRPEHQSCDDTPMDTRIYLHLLGALLYVVKSRPDIATAVSFGSTHAAHPTLGAYDELLHCLAYLQATQELGLILKTGDSGGPLKLRCYADASYLTHPDSKSQTGYCMSFGSVEQEGFFYAKSSKQTLVTTSSTHAEMRALYSLVIDIVYLINLCDELQRPLDLPCVVLVDNQPIIDLATAPSARSRRCKHFLMLIDWVREQVTAGYVELQKVPTAFNVADILTKIVTGGEFQTKAALLLGTY